LLKATANPELLTPEERAEAIRLIIDGLGKAELEITGSYPAPIVWIVEDEMGVKRMKGGTVFVLNTGVATFAVTAAHVVQEFFNDSKFPNVHCMIASHEKSPLRIPLGDRIIDANEEIDIATFRITPEEIQYLNRMVLQGHVRDWPPKPAEVGGPATYCGFPGVGRRSIEQGVVFGAVPMAGIVTNSHETTTSIFIERDHLVRVLGNNDMPENFNFGGMSGGPLLAIIQAEVMRTWRPAGVIIQGPNPGDVPTQEAIQGLEIIRARPIHFIKADGYLDLDRWQQANIR
jgi:hypothetical protein